jgi:hypothetical protein
MTGALHREGHPTLKRRMAASPLTKAPQIGPLPPQLPLDIGRRDIPRRFAGAGRQRGADAGRLARRHGDGHDAVGGVRLMRAGETPAGHDEPLHPLWQALLENSKLNVRLLSLEDQTIIN